MARQCSSPAAAARNASEAWLSGGPAESVRVLVCPPAAVVVVVDGARIQR